MADDTVLAKPGLDGEMTTKPLVLLLTFGTGGDLQPFVVLAAALAAREYRTLLVVQRSTSRWCGPQACPTSSLARTNSLKRCLTIPPCGTSARA